MSTLTGNDVYGLMEAYQAVYAPQELTEEQVWEEVEEWVNTLIEEGYDLSDYTWEEMFESYLEEIYGTNLGGNTKTKPNKLDTAVSNVASSIANFGKAPPRPAGSTFHGPGVGWVGPKNVGPKIVGPKIVGPKIVGPGPTPPPRQQSPAAPAARNAAPVTRNAAPAKPASAIKTAPASTTTPTPAPSSPRVKDTSITDMIGRSQLRQGAPINTGNKSSDARTIATGASVGSFQKPAAPAPARPMGSARERMLRQSFDPFDVIKGHLLDEGYADTEEAALVIMANMSEDWRESIVEGDNYEKNRKRAAARAEARNAARDAGQTGAVPGVGYVSPRREKISLRDKFGDAAGTRMAKAKPPSGDEKH